MGGDCRRGFDGIYSWGRGFEGRGKGQQKCRGGDERERERDVKWRERCRMGEGNRGRVGVFE